MSNQSTPSSSLLLGCLSGSRVFLCHDAVSFRMNVCLFKHQRTGRLIAEKGVFASGTAQTSTSSPGLTPVTSRSRGRFGEILPLGEETSGPIVSVDPSPALEDFKVDSYK